MDLSQASDSISHQTLLVKWKYLALYKSYYKWVESYLTDRSQSVEIPHTTNNKLSKFQSAKQNIKHGVPQGSILGSLLFISYANDSQTD